MPQYFFILGRNPTLSIAEILSVFDLLSISFSIKVISREVLIIESKDTVVAHNLIKALGGTVKIGRIISSAGFDEDGSRFQGIFDAENIVNNFLTKKEGKIHFGMSVYDGGADKNTLAKIEDEIKTLNITIKENLRKEGLKAGFVRIKERTLSSVSVWKNQLLTHGMEIVLTLTEDAILVGKTSAVQEFESFSFRDYGRPERDKRSGIIPPKLARIMINLGAIPKDRILLDPFCGSGTILQEAIILGYKNIMGSDISSNAIFDTKKNIDWLFDHYRNFERSDYNIDIFRSDVISITSKIKPDMIDAIVAEPYLGPPLYRPPGLDDADKIFREVEILYLSAFREFYKILKRGGKIIFIFPAFEVNGTMQFIPVLDKIKTMGFTQKKYFPQDLETNRVVQLTPRGTILYGSREHFIKREITYWQKG